MKIYKSKSVGKSIITGQVPIDEFLNSRENKDDSKKEAPPYHPLTKTQDKSSNGSFEVMFWL